MRRGSRLGFAIAFAFALLAEALIVSIASLPTSWHLSWWEWHVLMVISFFTIAAAAQQEWFEERFSALYLDETLAGRREVTVVFADLAGFTPFSEANGPEAVHQMLIAYFGELAPMIVDEFDGEVQDFVGDQIFAIFNKRGDQPDHALRGARAALELQRRAATHPPARLAARSAAASIPARSSPAWSAPAGTASTASSATRSTSARAWRARRRPAGS